MRVSDLPTPALIADADIIAENMKHMNEILQGKPARLRPHYKSHKCAALAHRQMAEGAVGITCAKLSEAEDMIFSGIDNILIANQVVEPAKILRLAVLAGMCRLTVCVDATENARALSAAAVSMGSTIHCLVEYDIGMGRCGVRTKEAYLEVAQAIAGLPNLVFDGIQAYAGYASHMADPDERLQTTLANEKKVADLKQYLHDHGIEVETVSGGSTGTAAIKADGGVYTELQAGSYLFMDTTYQELKLPFRNSLFVLATVISKSDGTVILDAGVKTIGADQDAPVVLDAEQNLVCGKCELNEEHLIVTLCDADGDGGRRWNPNIGEKVRVIPGHCCSTVNLHDRIYLFSGETVTDRIAVTARGKSQ